MPGSSTGSSPKLTTQAKPSPRVKASTSGADGSQANGPSPRSGSARRSRSAARYSDELRGRIAGLGLDAQRPPRRRLRQPRSASGRREPERRRLAAPRQRDPTPVPPALVVAGAHPDRVLEQLVGDVLHLLQPEFVALVDVDAARERHREQRCGAGAAAAELEVASARRACGRRIRTPVSRAAVARDVADRRRGWRAPRSAGRRRARASRASSSIIARIAAASHAQPGRTRS